MSTISLKTWVHDTGFTWFLYSLALNNNASIHLLSSHVYILMFRIGMRRRIRMLLARRPRVKTMGSGPVRIFGLMAKLGETILPDQSLSYLCNAKIDHRNWVQKDIKAGILERGSSAFLESFSFSTSTLQQPTTQTKQKAPNMFSFKAVPVLLAMLVAGAHAESHTVHFTNRSAPFLSINSSILLTYQFKGVAVERYAFIPEVSPMMIFNNSVAAHPHPRRPSPLHRR